MKILIITAHPSSKGFTHKIANRYKKGAESEGAEVEIFDLYDCDVCQTFLRFEDLKEIDNEDESRKIIHDKMSWADEIIFVHPLWWGGPPAILKNFVDQNITSGFAFKYKKRKYLPKWLNLLPEGLMKGKWARLYITCDSPKWVYALIGMPFVATWFFFVFIFCGFKMKSHKVFDRMRFSSDEKQARRLDKVERTGGKSARKWKRKFAS